MTRFDSVVTRVNSVVARVEWLPVVVGGCAYIALTLAFNTAYHAVAGMFCEMDGLLLVSDIHKKTSCSFRTIESTQSMQKLLVVTHGSLELKATLTVSAFRLANRVCISLPLHATHIDGGAVQAADVANVSLFVEHSIEAESALSLCTKLTNWHCYIFGALMNSETYY